MVPAICSSVLLPAQVVAGEDIKTAIRFAQAAAALHISTPLVRRASINAAQVVDFLAARPS